MKCILRDPHQLVCISKARINSSQVENNKDWKAKRMPWTRSCWRQSETSLSDAGSQRANTTLRQVDRVLVTLCIYHFLFLILQNLKIIHTPSH